jgi:hypothetical protein
MMSAGEAPAGPIGPQGPQPQWSRPERHADVYHSQVIQTVRLIETVRLGFGLGIGFFLAGFVISTIWTILLAVVIATWLPSFLHAITSSRAGLPFH